MQRGFDRRRRRGASLAFVLIATLARTTLGAPDADDTKPPSWNELRIDEPEGGAKTKTAARRMLVDGQISDQKVFDAYWRYFFAQMTWYEMRDELANMRLDLKNQLKRRSGPPQQRLVRTIAFPALRQIARDEKYATIVRCNALLMLGELNQKEPDGSGKGAVALPEAVPVLLEFLDPSRSVNDTNDALRNVALCEIISHANPDRGGIADRATRDKVAKVLKQIIDEKTPPAGRLPEVHEWILQRAAEALEALQPRAAAVTAGRTGARAASDPVRPPNVATR